MWMLHNNLQLNDDKTKILVVHAKRRPAPYLDRMQVLSAQLELSEHARMYVNLLSILLEQFHA